MIDDPRVAARRDMRDREESAPLPVATTTVGSELAHVNDTAGHRLTANETRLLEWLAAGRTNAQIAKCANRSGKTVSNQLTRLYAKLSVVNRTEAVATYLRRR